MGAVRLTVGEFEDGGFFVAAPARHPFEYDGMLFAASTLDEALNYVRLKMRREREAERPSGDPTRPRHETLHGPVSGLDDTADLNQYGRNALAHAVNRRRA